jgi:hypothetical protein
MPLSPLSPSQLIRHMHFFTVLSASLKKLLQTHLMIRSKVLSTTLKKVLPADNIVMQDPKLLKTCSK